MSLNGHRGAAESHRPLLGLLELYNRSLHQDWLWKFTDLELVYNTVYNIGETHSKGEFNPKSQFRARHSTAWHLPTSVRHHTPLPVYPGSVCMNADGEFLVASQ